MLSSVDRLTPDALLALAPPANGGHYELSDGELIIVGNAGALHELIKTKIFELLTEYRLRTKSGRAFAETQFTIRTDRARIPDVAWVSQDKLPLIPRENRAIQLAPDVVIEIVSDSEQPQETERRLRDYLEAGCEVWQIFPATSGVTVWRRNEGFRLANDDVLASERLPGFAVPVQDVFRI